MFFSFCTLVGCFLQDFASPIHFKASMIWFKKKSSEKLVAKGVAAALNEGNELAGFHLCLFFCTSEVRYEHFLNTLFQQILYLSFI